MVTVQELLLLVESLVVIIALFLGKKMNRKMNDKGWIGSKVIEEENGGYGNLDRDLNGVLRRVQFFFLLLFVGLF
jgi:hypothetical protein